jgi:phosphoglycolate phosphatase-like HAD superfamily hydrolase
LEVIELSFDLARVKGLCFDVDGTLSDTDDAYVARLTRMLRPMKFLFRGGDPTHFSRWLVMVTESPLNGLYHWLDRNSLDDEAARLFSRLVRSGKARQKKFWLMRGTLDLLLMVRERYPLTVVSARDAETTGRFLNQFDLEKFFKAVVTSQTCEFTKPFPHPVRHAVQAMNLPAEDCVMIGDTTVDILAGKRAGAQTIGLLCGFGTVEELRKAGADLIVNDLEELKQVLLAG